MNRFIYSVVLAALFCVVGCLVFVWFSALRPVLASSITNLNPDNTIAGSADITLTVSASDFETSTVNVLWNGTPLSDYGVVDANTITAIVPSSYVSMAGFINVTLLDTQNGASDPMTFTVNNPTPTINEVTPSGAIAGSAFTVTITGTGYANGTQMVLDSTPLNITAQTSETLEAIAVADVVTRSGTYTLSVVNATPGGGSASTPFTITAGPLAAIGLTPTAVTLPASTTQVFTATGYDAFGNTISPFSVTWSTTNGSVESSGELTATYRAGTTAGAYPAALQASNGNISATADVTIQPGSPTTATLTAAPGLIKTDGISQSTIVARVFDVYGNGGGSGVPISFTAACPGVCTVSPLSESTDGSGSVTATLTSSWRSATQTLSSLIRVTAVVSPADVPDGYITKTVNITGTFSPYLLELPMVMNVHPLLNHTVCEAARVAPPATAMQNVESVHDFYRFTALSSTYVITINDYSTATSGRLSVWTILADRCAISTTNVMDLHQLTNPSILIVSPTHILQLTNVLSPGIDYLIWVNNIHPIITALPYRITVVPVPPASASADGYKQAQVVGLIKDNVTAGSRKQRIVDVDTPRFMNAN